MLRGECVQKEVRRWESAMGVEPMAVGDGRGEERWQVEGMVGVR